MSPPVTQWILIIIFSVGINVSVICKSKSFFFYKLHFNNVIFYFLKQNKKLTSCIFHHLYMLNWNLIGSAMVSVLTSIVVDHWFESWSDQTKDYKIGICWFPSDSSKHTPLRSKSKDWLARNQDDVFEWGNMSNRGVLFQWASTIEIQLTVLI